MNCCAAWRTAWQPDCGPATDEFQTENSGSEHFLKCALTPNFFTSCQGYRARIGASSLHTRSTLILFMQS